MIDNNYLVDIFKSTPSPSLLLMPDSPNFTIIYASKSFLKVTGINESSLIGKGLFEVFYDDNKLPPFFSIASLRDSLLKVIRSKTPHKMSSRHYSITPDPERKMQIRNWKQENTPILNKQNEVLYILYAAMNEDDICTSRLSHHMEDALDIERKRIGREIHDELGQHLTAINMDAIWIDKQIPENKTLLKIKLKNIIKMLDESHQSIGTILNDLRADLLHDRDLPDAISWLADRFTFNTGIPALLSTSNIEFQPSEPIANCIFRVCQEALTNITRHAHASKVSISLNFSQNTIQTTIQDNGNGFDPRSVKNKKTFGLEGMKERVIALGGIYKLVSSPGKGTEILIRLPSSPENTMQIINEKNTTGRRP